MNSLLMKHRPKGVDKEKWEGQWAAGADFLQPLADVLKEMVKERHGKVRPDDFDCPNHYAKLVAELAEQQILKQILEMLPSGVDK